MPRITPLVTFSAEECVALDRFAAENGHRWKSTLGTLWMTGRDAEQPNGATLRRIRNNYGPSRLKDYRPRGLLCSACDERTHRPEGRTWQQWQCGCCGSWEPWPVAQAEAVA